MKDNSPKKADSPVIGEKKQIGSNYYFPNGSAQLLYESIKDQIPFTNPDEFTRKPLYENDDDRHHQSDDPNKIINDNQPPSGLRIFDFDKPSAEKKP